MAYCVVRIYKSDASAEAVMEHVRTGLGPKIAQIPGFNRYFTFKTSDGRMGSYGVFDNKAAAEQSTLVARDFIKGTPELPKMTLDESMQGEIGLSITGSPLPSGTGHAVMRLYRTAAPFAEVNAAIEQEALGRIRDTPGMFRYSTAKLEDGRIATFGGFATEQGAKASVAMAKELLQKAGSKIAKLGLGTPQVIEATILYAVAK